MSEPVWVPLGASPPAIGLYDAYAMMRDERADGTNAGSASALAWHTRVLNTLKADGQGIIRDFASNRFTLQAGTYYIRARAPAVAINNSRLKLYNITDAADVLIGPNIYMSASAVEGADALVSGRFTITSAKVFEIVQYCQAARGTDGLGTNSVGEANVEVYAEVEVWREAPGTPPGPQIAVVPPPLLTTLPASPVDGQEIILTDSLTAGTYHWHFRYVAARATNKWVFVGGAPLTVYVATQETTTSGVYVGLTTPGPSLTVPVVGDYLVQIGAHIDSAEAALLFMSYDIGATGANDNDSIYRGITGPGQGAVTTMPPLRKNAISGALVAKYKTSAGTGYFGKRSLSVEPIAVGG